MHDPFTYSDRLPRFKTVLTCFIFTFNSELSFHLIPMLWTRNLGTTIYHLVIYRTPYGLLGGMQILADEVLKGDYYDLYFSLYILCFHSMGTNDF